MQIFEVGGMTFTFRSTHGHFIGSPNSNEVNLKANAKKKQIILLLLFIFCCFEDNY